MTATKITLDQYREYFPVRQVEGRWCWRRVNGCIDLCARRWDTQAEAEADRDAHYQEYLRGLVTGDAFSR